MTTKTQRDLNLEYWGRIHDMCDAYNKEHGTNIKPRQCVKVDGGKWNVSPHPVFDIDQSDYSLAVAIIEGKPVFVGDNIYYKQDGYKATVEPGSVINPKEWTLTPPKQQKTFDLNGQQLPCPVRRASITSTMIELRIAGHCFHFNSAEDRNKVALTIVGILDDARDRS